MKGKIKIKKTFLTAFWMIITFCTQGEASPLIVINEFFADPPSGLLGDANQDGIRSASDDEFVELLNLGPETNLHGWSLWDSATSRHQFQPDTLLGPWERLVVFGGGNLNHFPGLAFKASSGSLNLNNTGDSLILKNALGDTLDTVFFGAEGNRDQSLVRFPEGVGSFHLHASVSTKDLIFSPGADVEGKGHTNLPLTPEPYSLLLILAGLGALGIKFRCRSTSE